MVGALPSLLGLIEVLDLQKEMRNLLSSNPSLMPEVGVAQHLTVNSSFQPVNLVMLAASALVRDALERCRA